MYVSNYFYQHEDKFQLHNTVTTIENGTFDGCSALKSVSIPNSVTSIGEYAFYRCI